MGLRLSRVELDLVVALTEGEIVGSGSTVCRVGESDSDAVVTAGVGEGEDGTPSSGRIELWVGLLLSRIELGLLVALLVGSIVGSDSVVC